MVGFYAYAKRDIEAREFVYTSDLVACGHCKAIIDPDVPHSCPGMIEEQRQDKIREAIRTLEREGYHIIPPTF